MNDNAAPTPGPTPPESNESSQPFWQAPTPEGVETDKDAKLYGMLCHLLALTGLATAGVGFIVGPLIMWLVKREESPFVDDQGKEAVNFQLTCLIGAVGLMIAAIFTLGLSAVAALALWVADIVFSIMAGLKANEGVRYRYPFNWRIIK